MGHLARKAMAQPEPINQEVFDRLLVSLRPKLHRYSARMVGSSIDGEDVVQEALVKAIEAFSRMTAVSNIESWLFRIVNNSALDFLRQQLRQQSLAGDEELARIADPIDAVQQRQAAAAGLRAFMQLPIAQRSSVILMDVLGYSLEEIGRITGSTVPAVKAALHRGRERLREAMEEPDDRPLPALSEADLALCQPLTRRGLLALRAMSIAARVIGDLRVGAVRVLAARHVAAECCRAAVLDRRHYLELAEADMAGIGLTPCRSMAAE